MNKSKIVVADSDSIIALLHENDSLNAQAIQIVKFLSKNNFKILYPTTVIVEASTTLQRKLTLPDLVKAFIDKVQKGADDMIIVDITEEILHEAIKLFDSHGSKQNTLFDAIVAAVAKKYNTKLIFSFDDWYTKAGFKLTGKMN